MKRPSREADNSPLLNADIKVCAAVPARHLLMPSRVASVPVSLFRLRAVPLRAIARTGVYGTTVSRTNGATQRERDFHFVLD